MKPCRSNVAKGMVMVSIMNQAVLLGCELSVRCISTRVSSCDYRNSASCFAYNNDRDARYARNGQCLSEPEATCERKQFGSQDKLFGPYPLFVARAVFLLLVARFHLHRSQPRQLLSPLTAENPPKSGVSNGPRLELQWEFCETILTGAPRHGRVRFYNSGTVDETAVLESARDRRPLRTGTEADSDPVVRRPGSLLNCLMLSTCTSKL